MINVDKISAISLIAATKCNLSCEYCEIHQNKFSQTAAAELNNNTIKALKDGSYLNNVKNGLSRLGIGTRQIKLFSIWGQEPLLILPYFNEHLEDWIESFPEWNFMNFSSNAAISLDPLIDFIIKLDENVKNIFTLDLQFSYDGELGTTELRKTSGDIIHSNIKNFLEKMNNISLKKVFVDIHGHNVVSQKVFTEINTIEKITNYYNEMNQWMHSLSRISKNDKVRVTPVISGAVQQPLKASIDDGLNFANFLRRSRQLGPIEESGSVLHRPGIGLRHCWDYFFQVLNNHNYSEPEDLLKEKEENPVRFFEIMRELSQGTFCGHNYTELKIMYDGTVLPCQNYMFSLKDEYIANDKSIKNNSLKAHLNKKIIYNILNSDLKDIEISFKLYKMIKENSYFYIFSHMITLMKLLALSGQIDESYLLDEKKVMTHAMFLAGLFCCEYNNNVSTGSILHKGTGFIRLYCNGALDIIFDERKNYVIRGERN